MVFLVLRDWCARLNPTGNRGVVGDGEMTCFHVPKPKDSKAHSANDGHQQDGHSDYNSDPGHSGHHHATTAIPIQSAPKAKAFHQLALRIA